MKSLFCLIVAFAFGLSSCLSMMGVEGPRTASDYRSGKFDHELIDAVSFDTECPKKKIKILKRKDEMGHGMYNIKACGKKLKYKRSGTVFHAADKKPY